MLMIYVVPGCESWCKFNGKNISEQEAGKIKWRMIKEGAKVTTEILPNGECQQWIEKRG